MPHKLLANVTIAFVASLIALAGVAGHGGRPGTAMTPDQNPTSSDAYGERIERRPLDGRDVILVGSEISEIPPSCGTPDTPKCEGKTGPTGGRDGIIVGSRKPPNCGTPDTPVCEGKTGPAVERDGVIVGIMKPPNCGTPNTPECEAFRPPTPPPVSVSSASRRVSQA